MRVFITGLGIISAIGNNVDEHRKSLIEGQSGIKKASLLETRYTDIFPFGEITISTEDLKIKAQVQDKKNITRTEVLAILATQQAIESAKLSNEDLQSYDTALISASTVGGMSLTDELYSDINKLNPASDFLETYSGASHTNQLIRRYGIKGVSTTFNTACSSSANAIMFGAKLIKTGRAKRVIVGGTDALAKFTVNGFNALRILSPHPCLPFDENRSGLTLGEGAAYLVLEAETIVGDKTIYGEVSGYGNTNDAFHPSSISDEATGIIASISEAIKDADLLPSDIDYINAHGTGTLNNDSSEQTGLDHVFDQVPPFQSTKAYTGHTLAAAGAIEAIFCLLAINNNELYPTINCPNPISKYGIFPIKTYQTNQSITHVLSNSFGFGGNCSSLVLSKV